MAKKAFDLPRNSIYVADPTTQIGIVGGKGELYGSERGKLDTEPGDAALDDLIRLRERLSEDFVANIDHYGVIVPVVVAKVDGIMVVVDGRTRVRAARVVNAARKKRGDLPMTLHCEIRRDNDAGLIGAMIATNNARHDDTTASKIEKAKRMMARGVDEARVAVSFGVKVATVRGWLDFEDNATSQTKRAVAAGRLSATGAAQLARLKDPEKQNAALDKLLEAPGKRTVTAAKVARGATVTPSRTDLRAFADALGKSSALHVLTKEQGSSAHATMWLACADEIIEWALTGKKSPSVAAIMGMLAAKTKEPKAAHAAGGEAAP